MKDKHDKRTKDLFETAEISNIVYRNGKPVLELNSRLIAKQGLLQEEVDKIKELHIECIMLEEQLETASRQEDISYLFGEWTRGHHQLQKIWGFPEDANYHPSHRLPGCSCPKLDGDDRLGTKYRVVTQGCPIHDPS